MIRKSHPRSLVTLACLLLSLTSSSTLVAAELGPLLVVEEIVAVEPTGGYLVRTTVLGTCGNAVEMEDVDPDPAGLAWGNCVLVSFLSVQDPALGDGAMNGVEMEDVDPDPAGFPVGSGSADPNW